ncbi:MULTISPECIES: Mov34/MPN/PAD-1 family protein [unclassified Paenibacillus]|uniref:Mov34/MPN/PAD-1 family protein n=1 Tax=unclassified Paenibacillus TaxID=185978 RepID=UPI00278885D1|nr:MULTISPECIES: Mov34/MPN/PAD-1 family protein [unclassified Paenibacillus]MDQ0896401.1 PRTRC genetic system protein A [Paenibacillus sp. V4I7]MDQ0914055.1 PRTRC genetic system protein A [Paenibacillus sp. V4I5]
MDLLTMLGIDAGAAAPVVETGKNASKKKQQTNDKGTAKSDTKGAKSKVKPKPTIRRYETQADIRKMLVGLDWTVHYAMHSFSVSDLSRRLVEMNDQDIEEVKTALWGMVPQEVKEDLDKARQAKAEAEAAIAAGGNVEGTGEGARDSEMEDEEEDDLEVDEDNDEVVVKKPQPQTSTETKIPEVQEGELTVDMLRLALALDYFEFANEEAVAWRVDKENKRLTPSISAGKMGNSFPAYQAFHWKLSEFEKAPSKPINYVAGRDGRLYEVRENKHLKVTVAAQVVPTLENVTEGVSFKMNKIPGVFLKQTLDFFKHFVLEKREALVYVAWNRTTEAYELHCPEQWANVVNVEADYPDDPERDIVLIMHSHHVMPAVFSAVDDRNDKALCVYGVFGNLDKQTIDHRFRAGFNGQHLYVNIADVFDVESTYSACTFPPEWVDRVHQYV